MKEKNLANAKVAGPGMVRTLGTPRHFGWAYDKG